MKITLIALSDRDGIVFQSASTSRDGVLAKVLQWLCEGEWDDGNDSETIQKWLDDSDYHYEIQEVEL